MHKGYAFVQFTNPFDARNACHGEDGKTVLSQTLGEFKLRVYIVGIYGYIASYAYIFSVA